MGGNYRFSTSTRPWLNVIDFDIMWDIIQNDIPNLLTQLRALDLIRKFF